MAIRKINSRAIADGAVATADLDDNPLTIDSLTVDTNTLVVDAANNLVGVGTSAPSGAKLEIFTGSTATDGLKINRFGSGVYYSTLRQNSHGLSIHVGDGSTIAERVAITPNGITFNGDTAAVNALDDYEEGTWSSSPLVGTYAFNNPRYTKIGRMVHCHAQIGTISDNSSSQSIRIQLPFAAVANDTAVNFGTLYVNVSRNPIVGAYISASTDMILYVNNTFSQLFHSDTASNTSIYAAWSYMAAS